MSAIHVERDGDRISGGPRLGGYSDRVSDESIREHLVQNWHAEDWARVTLCAATLALRARERTP